ncbi:hypothetical protein RCG23_07095 [Neobacillus sp. PS3-34]|nr:hypothetical protein [Neobacillus sp. PS3-34]WML49709.1 hypothetical protein RCG23_07095 [Neobacillus sp. PS3-34]
MFNEYEVLQMLRLRQEEIEMITQNAWKHFFQPLKKKNRKN